MIVVSRTQREYTMREKLFTLSRTQREDMWRRQPLLAQQC
jgi:hypothetical protein